MPVCFACIALSRVTVCASFHAIAKDTPVGNLEERSVAKTAFEASETITRKASHTVLSIEQDAEGAQRRPRSGCVRVLRPLWARPELIKGLGPDLGAAETAHNPFLSIRTSDTSPKMPQSQKDPQLRLLRQGNADMAARTHDAS